ncbi:MAG: ABC transporter ATP-binding protein [Acetobacteraceae bacterium]|nr:ABC transporter ATP-binding protein [Acetobacteraceae bacterium]
MAAAADPGVSAGSAEGPAIEASGLVGRYGSTVALDGLDVHAERGEVLGLLGHNGAGKTTLVRILGCLLLPHAGEARVLGRDIRDPAARREIRRRIGVLPQDPGLYDRLTAAENLFSHGLLYGLSGPTLARRVDGLLELVGLQGVRRSQVGTFSGGMKKRLAIARALVNDPELVFLDEPTTNLDPEAAHAVHGHIVALAAQGGRTVVLCTHNLNEAERLCRRVVILRQGREVASGSPQELERRFRGARRAEITVRSLDEAALKAVRSAPGVAGVEVAGPKCLRLELAGEGGLPAAVAALVAAGAEVTRAVDVQPTLEDVYLRLASGGDAGPDGEPWPGGGPGSGWGGSAGRGGGGRR